MTEQQRLFPEGRRPRAKKPVAAGKLQAAARSLAWLRRRGYVAEKCEQWIPQPQGDKQRARYAGGFRKDLFGFADLIAFSPVTPGVIAVQCTSRQQVSAHLRLYRQPGKARDQLVAWLAQPNRLFLILGWEPIQIANRSTAGSRVKWTFDQRWITTSDLVG